MNAETTQIAPDSGVAEGERAAFEHWMSDEGTNPRAVDRDRTKDGYLLAQTNWAWIVWKGAYAVHHATIARLQREAEGLTRERDEARRVIREKNLVLISARNTFRSYAQMHMDKGTVASAEKAIYNHAMAEDMDAALNIHPD